MSARKSADLSPEGIARLDRRRLAAEEGAQALAEVERKALELRTNMARLRDLREAKEAADAIARASLPAPASKKRKKKLPP